MKFPDGVAGDLYWSRIEANRFCTVYRVFTDVPAIIAGRAMVGLDRQTATDCMLAVNLVNASSGMRRIHLDPPRLDAGEIGAPGWR